MRVRASAALIWLFYTAKPMIPRSLQIALRRQIARYKRRKYAHIWPIDPNSATPPKGWQGWPDGKQFALVLSHDVDTLKGYNNVLKLVDLEEQMGFRSAFNFVPERYGRISLDLLDELRKRGFGVAVHGLKHDGKLFLTQYSFERQATRINAYLKKWKTEGFTSPSMYHNLEWLSGLNIKYSTSTFDTDPFEPQPDGVGTIFPFFVPKRLTNQGFFEMPYTLPQDSTLFIILQEQSINIWKQKLDWIAAKGGMVLLNTHPDYMNFDGNCLGDLEYPFENYRDFLEYIQSCYAGNYFHVLPQSLADLCGGWSLQPESLSQPCIISDQFKVGKPCQQSSFPLGSRKSLRASSYQTSNDEISKTALLPKEAFHRRLLRICMLTYSFYESDNRVRRYAETLVSRGDDVDVISLRREGQEGYGELYGVKIFRVQERVRDEKGKRDYLIRLIKFLFRSAALLTRKHFEKPYDIVHVHSVPDFEVFAALIPKLRGAKIILDIHDIVPELYANKFNLAKDSFVFKALVLTEKLSIGLSDHAIISNDLWWEKLVSRSVGAEKCTTILNYPDERLFSIKCLEKKDEKMVILYPGTLNQHQGLDIAIRAFSKIKDSAVNAEFQIYGEGPARNDLLKLIDELGLENRVYLKDPVSLDEIVGVMARADIGIIPKKNDDFGGEAFSTKSLEFMILGVPVIMSRTRIDNYYFNDSIVKFCEPEDVDDFARGMLSLIKNSQMRANLVRQATKFAKAHSWRVKNHVYLNLVDSL